MDTDDFADLHPGDDWGDGDGVYFGAGLLEENRNGNGCGGGEYYTFWGDGMGYGNTRGGGDANGYGYFSCG